MKKLSKHIFYDTATDGINLGLVVGDDAVVCIDLPVDPLEADEWRKEVRQFSGGKPIRAVIFTSSERLNSECLSIVGAPVIVHNQMFAQVAMPLEPLPTMPLEPPPPMPAPLRDLLSTPHWTFEESASVVLHGEKQIVVDVVYQGGCSPDGSMVFVRDQGIAFLGEHATVGHPPLLAQGDLPRWQEVLQALKANSDIKQAVPGRGAPCAPAVAADFTLEYIQTALTQVRAMVRAGNPRSELAILVPDLMAKYGPKPARGQKLTLDLDAVGRHVRAGLEHIYDNLKSGKLK